MASSRDSYVLRDGAGAGPLGTKAGQYSQNFTGYDTLDATKPAVALTDPANADGCKPFSDTDKAVMDIIDRALANRVGAEKTRAEMLDREITPFVPRP